MYFYYNQKYTKLVIYKHIIQNIIKDYNLLFFSDIRNWKNILLTRHI